MQSPRYWRLRQQAQKLWFRFRVRWYLSRSSASAARRQTSITVAILGTAGGAGSAAIALLVGGEVAAQALSGPLHGLDFPFATELTSRPAAGTYEPLLLATIAFGATLLGLYFAAISIVVATGYGNARKDIRALVLNDGANTAYVKLITNVVAASLLLVAAEFIGYHLPTLTAVVLALLGAVAILVLPVLGPRSFYLLSVESVAYQLIDKFERSMREAISGVHGPEFEQRYQTWAQQSLDTYNAVLVRSLRSESASGVADLILPLCDLWFRYSVAKPMISPDSKWYAPRFSHADWWLTGDTEIALALNTGTAIRAREQPDYSWVEKQIVEILKPAVATLAERSEIGTLHRVAERLAVRARGIAGGLQVDDVLRTLTVFSSQQLESAPSPPQAPSVTSKRNAILDDIGLLLANIVLGVQDAAVRIGEEDVWQELDQAMSSGVTRAGSPLGAALGLISELRSGLAFERRAEGRQVTPKWWLRQVVARRLYVILDDALDNVVRAIDSDLITRAEASSDPVDAATLASRTLEVLDKLSKHLPTIESTLATLEHTQRSKDDPWPARTSADAPARTVAALDRVLDLLANRIVELRDIPLNEQPDFFGQAFFVLVSRCLEALVEERHERFVRLFPGTLTGAMLGHDRVVETFQKPNADQRSAAIAASGPLMDIMELSGYALVCRELGLPEGWNACRQTWDQWLATMPNPEVVLTTILARVRYREAQFALLPGEVIRTSREQRFEAYLARKIGVSDLWKGAAITYDPRGRRSKPVHPSPIVRMATMPFGMGEPTGVFIVEYIVPRLPAGVPLPRSAENVVEHFELWGRQLEDAGAADADDGDEFDEETSEDELSDEMDGDEP